MSEKKARVSARSNDDASRIDQIKVELRQQQHVIDNHIDAIKADADAADRASKILDDHDAAGEHVIGFLNGYAAACRAVAGRLPDSRELPF